MTLITGTWLKPDLTPDTGYIRFTLQPAARRSSGEQITCTPVFAVLDETGSISVDVVPDPDLIVDGTAVYHVFEEVGGCTRSWMLALDGGDPVDLPSRYPGDSVSGAAVLPLPGPQGPTGPQGPAGPPGELTQAAADFRYELRSALLSEAAWHVDAGRLTDAGDGLADLTGNGRDAVFGAGAARPIVLPHDGEDYLHLPGTDNNHVFDWQGNSAVYKTATKMVVTFDMLIHSDTGTSAFLFQHENGGGLRMHMGYHFNGRLYWRVYEPGGAIQNQDIGPILFDQRALHRITYDAAMLATYDTSTDGGATWQNRGSAQFAGDRIGMGHRWITGIGTAPWNTATAPHADIYSLTVVYDDEPSPEFDIQMSADTDYANLVDGTHSWTIGRSSSGYKTALVDRPLLLFGGGQTYTAPDVAGAGTRLRYRRAYGAGGGIGAVVTQHTGGPVALSGVTEEWLGEAIFDRALTDEEIAQATQGLLGLPHVEQPDPHTNYAPVIVGTIPAALPTGARQGSLTVLADGSAAIKTATGWQKLTTTPLTGAPPA